MTRRLFTYWCPLVAILAIGLGIPGFIISCSLIRAANEKGPKILANLDDATAKLGDLESQATHLMQSADYASSATGQLADAIKGTVADLKSTVWWGQTAIAALVVIGHAINILHRRKVAAGK